MPKEGEYSKIPGFVAESPVPEGGKVVLYNAERHCPGIMQTVKKKWAIEYFWPDKTIDQSPSGKIEFFPRRKDGQEALTEIGAGVDKYGLVPAVEAQLIEEGKADGKTTRMNQLSLHEILHSVAPLQTVIENIADIAFNNDDANLKYQANKTLLEYHVGKAPQMVMIDNKTIRDEEFNLETVKANIRSKPSWRKKAQEFKDELEEALEADPGDQ